MMLRQWITNAALAATLLAIAAFPGRVRAQGTVAGAMDGASAAPLPPSGVIQVYGPASQDDPVGPGDLLDVRVFNQPQLSGMLRVSSDGDIAPPFTHQLQVEGETPAQVETKLTAAYASSIVLHPLVSVRVAEVNSRKVAINGEVPRPGMYAFSGRLNLLQALALAGGVDPVKASQQVILLHGAPGPTTTAPNGETTFKLTSVLETIDLSQIANHPDLNRWLSPGDVIDVPEAHRVFISGDVMHPGEAALLPGLTITQLVSEMGGFLPQADHTQVRVLRLESNDTPGATGRKTILADVGAMQRNHAPDLTLEPDDIVIVSGAPMRIVGLQLLDFFSGTERWRVQQTVANTIP